jgi:hypothetical protein
MGEGSDGSSFVGDYAGGGGVYTYRTLPSFIRG